MSGDVADKVRGLQGLFVAYHGEPVGWRGKSGSTWPAWSQVFGECVPRVMRLVIVQDLGEGYGCPNLRDVVRAYEERMRGGAGPVVSGEEVSGEDRERVLGMLAALARVRNGTHVGKDGG